jgi:hypothetical protein
VTTAAATLVGSVSRLRDRPHEARQKPQVQKRDGRQEVLLAACLVKQSNALAGLEKFRRNNSSGPM